MNKVILDLVDIYIEIYLRLHWEAPRILRPWKPKQVIPELVEICIYIYIDLRLVGP